MTTKVIDKVYYNNGHSEIIEDDSEVIKQISHIKKRILMRLNRQQEQEYNSITNISDKELFINRIIKNR